MSKIDNKQYKILIVEDELAIREMIRLSLVRESYSVVDCETAEEALNMLAHQTIHLILLDWMLPGKSGIQLVKQIRESSELSDIPIIMLTAKVEEEDKLSGFAAGVDDYINKPFSLKELLARIQSILKRVHKPDKKEDVISCFGLTVDSGSHLVYTDNQDEIHLGPTEFKLLLFLMSNPKRVYSREQLLDHVWGVGVYVDERTVDVHIRRLRKALGEFKLEKMIRTVRGSGYSLAKPRN
ncbi:MAG: phosphate regulon transcriptional regulator PhoB [Ostreibacterium sp.]